MRAIKKTQVKIPDRTGQDRTEGKITLPLIHALNNTTTKKAEFIKEALNNPSRRQYLKEVLRIITETGSLDYTYQQAEKEIVKALSGLKCLPLSPFRTTLEEIAYASLAREF